MKGVFATRGGEVSLHRVRTDRTRVLRHGLRVTYLGLFRDQRKIIKSYFRMAMHPRIPTPDLCTHTSTSLHLRNR